MSDRVTMPELISKTTFLCGMQCPKYLWMVFHEPESIPRPDESMQFIFDQGRKVGELAKRLFPGGVDIPIDDIAISTQLTREQLKCDRPIFEASILSDRVYCRPDILVPNANGSWDIIEVKSSTGIKDVNIVDVAFQKYCCESIGLSIRNCSLACVNSNYVRHGDIDPSQFFVIEDISPRVDKIRGDIEAKVVEYFDIIAKSECPMVDIGPYCSKPFVCPLKEKCWSFLPTYSVFDLYWAGEKCFDLFSRKIIDMLDIPRDYPLSGKQKIQLESLKTNMPHINKAGLKEFIGNLEYPLYFVDFETFSTVVPPYEGTRPNQPIPFQFSVDILAEDDGPVEHHGFLSEIKDDPRMRFIAELEACLGDKGSIVVYHAPFEQKVLLELAGIFPQYRNWVSRVLSRVVDLLKPFVSFHYYHPDQHGKISLKRVLPLLTGMEYKGMAIENGMQAAVAYLNSMDEEVEEEQRQRIRRELELYCGLDTMGMIEILKRLKAAVN